MADYESREIGNGVFYTGDCFDVMHDLPDGVADMVLCDLPYGTTACKWDSVLPFDKLWTEYRRLAQGYGAIVLTSAQPFTSALVSSAYDLFKYSWVWEKSRPSGFAQAKNMPLKAHEDVCVFSAGVTVHAAQSSKRMPYNPQGVERMAAPKTYEKKSWSDSAFSKRPSHGAYEQTETNYPRSVLRFPSESGTIHPTQKPVALFEYLIRTYTNPGEVVLDNTAGSGTTAIAAENAGRRWICIERDPEYAAKAMDRIAAHVEESKRLI